MEDCLFCKIHKGEIPSTRVYEDENVIAFRDLYPQAKEHILFIHKRHTKNVNELVATDPAELSDVFLAIKKYTEDSKLTETGFRVVTNFGPDAGQTVFHTHFHLLGGQKLKGFGA